MLNHAKYYRVSKLKLLQMDEFKVLQNRKTSLGRIGLSLNLKIILSFNIDSKMNRSCRRWPVYYTRSQLKIMCRLQLCKKTKNMYIFIVRNIYQTSFPLKQKSCWTPVEKRTQPRQPPEVINIYTIKPVGNMCLYLAKER